MPRRRFVVIVVLLLAAAALGGVHAVGSALIRPVPAGAGLPPASLTAVPVTFASESGSTIHGWLSLPTSSRGVVHVDYLDVAGAEYRQRILAFLGASLNDRAVAHEAPVVVR